jgi:hypothetical protein
MGEKGVPCNGGIAFIIFVPILFIVSPLQILYFNKWLRNKPNMWLYRTEGIICTLFWGWPVIGLSGTDLLQNLLYLGPFLLFISLTKVQIFFIERSVELQKEP